MRFRRADRTLSGSVAVAAAALAEASVAAETALVVGGWEESGRLRKRATKNAMES